MGVRTALDEARLAGVDSSLAEVDQLLATRYPGTQLERQPVHTVYVPASVYERSLPAQWGEQAETLVEQHGGMATLASQIVEDAEGGTAAHSAAEIDTLSARVTRKLSTEPIEDLRIDFEDGYGAQGDAQEDEDALRAAAELGRAIQARDAPPSFGIRFKCLEAPVRRRGLRTLDLFVGALLDATGRLPDGFVITLPKVTAVAQVSAMVEICTALEAGHALPDGALKFEVQVETPQVILGAAGAAPVAKVIDAAAGRLTGLHFGTYDYSAAIGVSAEYQALDHPAADYAKNVMQVAAAGTGVRLSDGSTNIVPVGDTEHVLSAWRLHARLVRRSLGRAYYQGWDLHPGQLPTRYLANYAFFRGTFDRATRRVRDYLAQTEGEYMDEPATLRALSEFIIRGVHCGAVDEREVLNDIGISASDLAVRARVPGSTLT